MDVFQALNDVGSSFAPGDVTYWGGEVQQGTGYQDLDETPEAVADPSLAVNTVHIEALQYSGHCGPEGPSRRRSVSASA
ncbi:hypothetical protein [Streptomyces sp. NBC_00145]|uniref:hypothetical protein n=1 Tax=Streptomyces sp. NBC_00145 TaxID=2975666 RepID=UPI002E17BC34